MSSLNFFLCSRKAVPHESINVPPLHPPSTEKKAPHLARDRGDRYRCHLRPKQPRWSPPMSLGSFRYSKNSSERANSSKHRCRHRVRPRRGPSRQTRVEYVLEPFTVENGGKLIVERKSYVPGRSNVIIRLPGKGSKEEQLSFVGSHLDVVPADPGSMERRSL